MLFAQLVVGAQLFSLSLETRRTNLTPLFAVFILIYLCINTRGIAWGICCVRRRSRSAALRARRPVVGIPLAAVYIALTKETGVEIIEMRLVFLYPIYC